MCTLRSSHYDIKLNYSNMIGARIDIYKQTFLSIAFSFLLLFPFFHYRQEKSFDRTNVKFLRGISHNQGKRSHYKHTLTYIYIYIHIYLRSSLQAEMS